MYREVLLMFDGTSKPTLVVAALVGGLALFVAGFIIAVEIGSAVASSAAAAVTESPDAERWGPARVPSRRSLKSRWTRRAVCCHSSYVVYFRDICADTRDLC